MAPSLLNELLIGALLFGLAYFQNYAGSRASFWGNRLHPWFAANWDTTLDLLLIVEGIIIGRLEWVPLWIILLALPGGYIGSWRATKQKQIQYRIKQKRKREAQAAIDRAGCTPALPRQDSVEPDAQSCTDGKT